MRDNPKPYELYKHFKGNTYQIICIAKDSEDLSLKVVYQGMYAPYDIYVRSLDMFMEEVDHEKYPDARQRYRFELVGASSECTNTTATKAKIDGADQSTDEASNEATIKANSDSAKEAPKLLMDFLDADTVDAKLFVLADMEEDINEHILTSMELSLGMEPSESSLQERYRDIKNFLALKQKYERSHR